jgi:uncharacterized membrane protein
MTLPEITLPEITLPKIELPFDVPVLLHPFVDHFAIALPVIILLLELINLVARRRAISVLSLFLIILTLFAVAAAYITGGVDAKEAFDTLTKAGQAELKEHKNLGTYILIGSGVLLVFKLLSMMTGRALAKTVYLMFFVVFIAAMFKQGEEGGELVYKHGANVERVKILDDKIFDLEEALEEAVPEAIEPKEVVPKIVMPADNNQAETNETQSVPTEILPIERMPIETVPAALEVPPVATVPEALPADAIAVEEQNKEELVPASEANVEILEVKGMPEETVQPQIATH